MGDWESFFPNIGNWEKTSEPCTDYNCIGFAAGALDQWWEPFPEDGLGYYWPAGAARSRLLAGHVEAFRTLGYEVCEDGSLDPNKDKIVLYVNGYGHVVHAARQLTDGKWTSKMGNFDDIAHESPDSVAGEYGTPSCFMQRVRKANEAVVSETQASSDAETSKGVPLSDASNSNHREDFTSLLNAAARKREQED